MDTLMRDPSKLAVMDITTMTLRELENYMARVLPCRYLPHMYIERRGEQVVLGYE